MTPAPHIALLDVYAGGHRGQYVRQVVEHWGTHTLPGRLSIVVPPAFFEMHADVLTLIETTEGVEAVPLEMPGWPILGTPSLIRNDWAQGQVMRRVLPALRPDHCVLLYFDNVQLSLAMDLRFPFPITFSGIYFRPSFHYHRFDGGQMRGWKESLRDRRKRLVLAAALRNPHLSHLFSLDPYAIPDIQTLGSDTQVIALPDGITPRPAHQTPAALRTTWGVEAGRKVALFFGSIDGRKGIYQTMEALRHLPPNLQQGCCLAVVGRINQMERERVMSGLERVCQETKVQVVVEDRFVEEDEIQGIVGAADIVMLTYQRHIGSSGVLVRAAHAGIPVLGSDYGLVGEHLRRRHLGLAVDAASPQAIAEGLARGLADPQAPPFDAAEARRFADANTATLFAETIFQHANEAVKG